MTSASTKKALRTALQVLIPLVTWLALTGPTLLERVRTYTNVPPWVITTAAVIVAGAAILAKLWAWAEARFPQVRTWLTIDPPADSPAVPSAVDDSGLPGEVPVPAGPVD